MPTSLPLPRANFCYVTGRRVFALVSKCCLPLTILRFQARPSWVGWSPYILLTSCYCLYLEVRLATPAPPLMVFCAPSLRVSSNPTDYASSVPSFLAMLGEPRPRAFAIFLGGEWVLIGCRFPASFAHFFGLPAAALAPRFIAL